MDTPFSSAVLMIRPCNFGYNPETAATNIFQKKILLSQKEIQKRALREFENFVKVLHENKISVEIFNDRPNPQTPDSIFPNNWFSAHRNGLLIIYPMLATNRRVEKRKDILDFLKRKYHFKNILDLSFHEEENKFLEGTGSLVFDQNGKIGYANISSRTNKKLSKDICNFLGYETVIFNAKNSDGTEIYHTNVLLSIGNGFAIVCLDSIRIISERKLVKTSLEKSGLEIVKISFEQMNSFCGNALQLRNNDGENILVMSENAYKNFNKNQLKILKKYSKIIYSNLETIETVGGGSARCMLAEISFY